MCQIEVYTRCCPSMVIIFLMDLLKQKVHGKNDNIFLMIHLLINLANLQKLTAK